MEENTPVNTWILDLDATHLDATEGGNGNLIYQVRQGNEEGVFSLNEDTGEILVVGDLDYESKTLYTLVIDAYNSDDISVKDSTMVIVEVMNVNDHTPRPASAVFQYEVDEDASVGTSVGRVIFTDDDAEELGEITLSVTGCSSFNVDVHSGDITVKEELSYDDVSHVCFVTGTDGGQPARSGVTSVMITVRDVNDPPRFEEAAYTLKVYENTPLGTPIATLIAVDKDGAENGEVTYSLLSGDPNGVFSLNGNTGQLFLTSDLDPTLTSQYVLEVQAEDGGSPALTATASVTVDVVDVNDHEPVIALGSRSQQIIKDRMTRPGTTVATMQASDGDTGDNGQVTFAMTAGTPS